MPTSDLAAPTPANARKVVDVRFGRRLVVVNAAVPAALLGWDAWHHELGADAVKYVLHTTGLLGLIFLVLTLVVTPLRRFTDRPQLIALRRSLGLAGFFYLCAHFTVFFVFDRAGSVSSTVHEILVRRYLQIGAAALVLLVPAGVDLGRPHGDLAGREAVEGAASPGLCLDLRSAPYITTCR